MKRRLFEAIIGVVLLVIAVMLALFFQQTYSRSVELQSLPVPIHQIETYTLLTADMFEMKDFPQALSGGYATNLSQLTGKLSTSTIPAGLPVPLALISVPKDFRLADPDLEVMSIPIVLASSVGGQIRIGERINIYRLALIEGPSAGNSGGGTDGLTIPGVDVTLIASKVPVVWILGGNGVPVEKTEGGANKSAQILLLAVNQAQLEAVLQLMAELKQGSLMWITLAPVSP